MTADAVNATTFAVVGTGRMAAVMAEDLAAADFARLTTVVSRSRDRARAFAADFDIPARHTLNELQESHVHASRLHESGFAATWGLGNPAGPRSPR